MSFARLSHADRDGTEAGTVAVLALRVLSEASAALVSSLDLDAVIARLAEAAVPALADWCVVDLAEDGVVRRAAARHADPALQPVLDEISRRFPPDGTRPSLARATVETGRSQLVADVTDGHFAAFSRHPDQAALVRRIGLRSYIVAPLAARGRLLGVLALVSAHRRFGDADLALAEELGRRAALAVDNARLFRESELARQRAEHAAALTARLQRVTTALAGATATADVVRVMLDHGLAAVGATAGVVCRLSAAGDEIERVWALGYPEDGLEGFRRIALTAPLPPRDVVQTRAAVYVESPEAWLERFLPPGPGMETAPAAAGLPMMVGERLVGVMVLRFPAPRAFPDDDRALLQSVASQCAQALERARLLEAERAARAEAEEANRAKMQFLTVMSHELRTPLNAIAGYAELLELGIHGPVTGAQREALSRIQKSERHLLGLINDVLNFAKLDAGHAALQIGDVAVHSVAAGLEALVQPQLAAKGLRYALRQERQPLVARADAEKVQQVLLNLLSNAIKFTPAGGSIEVRSGPAEDGRVRVEVRDSGIGIPADRLEHVFEPFVQLDRTLTSAHEGTGLGLAISRDLARLMGGELTVESAVGAGSTFTLLLPAGG